MAASKQEVLDKLHKSEDAFNVEIGNIDKEIKKLQSRKLKLQRFISNNMKARNKVIEWS